MLLYDFDRALREIQRTMNRAESAVMVREIGRSASGPRRRQAPLNDRYDAVTNWTSLLLVGMVGFLALVGIGVLFGQVVLWAERAVRP